MSQYGREPRLVCLFLIQTSPFYWKRLAQNFWGICEIRRGRFEVEVVFFGKRDGIRWKR